MTTELATKDIWGVMEKVVVEGDLSRLSPKEKVEYYRQFCESLGLNPLTRPFDYLQLDNKLVLYAKKEASEQLRLIKNVSVYKTDMRIDKEAGLIIYTAYVSQPDGRSDVGTGVVATHVEKTEWKTNPKTGKSYKAGTGTFEDLQGNDFANAIMKAETKAKRRATLSICGLGLLDETEIETIPNARTSPINLDTGEAQGKPQLTVVAGDNQTVEPATGEIVPKPMQAQEFAAWLARMNLKPDAVATHYKKASIKEWVAELKQAGNSDPLRSILQDYVIEVLEPGKKGWVWAGTEPMEAEDVPF